MNNTISNELYTRKHYIKYQSFQNQKIDLLLSFIWDNSLEGEVWKEIKDTNSNYFVSNCGRVLSLCCNGYKLLNQWLCNGYYYVNLSINGKVINYRVNRLVAEAFINNPENKPIVHHKDTNKKNNILSNLEYKTYKEHSDIHNEKEYINNA